MHGRVAIALIVIGFAGTSPFKLSAQSNRALPASHARPSVLQSSLSLPSDHVHLGLVPGQVIDGSKNPELIPDSVAYRLYFVATAIPVLPTDEQTRIQRARLGSTGLAQKDKEALSFVLANFTVQHAEIVKAYNDGAAQVPNKAQCPALAYAQLLAQRDQLVHTTRDKLNTLLTPQALTQLDSYIQKEK